MPQRMPLASAIRFRLARTRASRAAAELAGRRACCQGVFLPTLPVRSPVQRLTAQGVSDGPQDVSEIRRRCRRLPLTGGIAMPALVARAAAKTLRFVPQANLANFDPIWGTQYVVRNAAALVWDTLYGIDEKFQPQRQMVESEEVSADGLTWTFKLRPGLKFH